MGGFLRAVPVESKSLSQPPFVRICFLTLSFTCAFFNLATDFSNAACILIAEEFLRCYRAAGTGALGLQVVGERFNTITRGGEACLVVNVEDGKCAAVTLIESFFGIFGVYLLERKSGLFYVRTFRLSFNYFGGLYLATLILRLITGLKVHRCFWSSNSLSTEFLSLRFLLWKSSMLFMKRAVWRTFLTELERKRGLGIIPSRLLALDRHMEGFSSATLERAANEFALYRLVVLPVI